MNRIEESFTKKKTRTPTEFLEKEEKQESFSEMPNYSSNTSSSSSNWFTLDTKNILIILLIVFILFPALITSIVIVLGDSFKSITDFLKPIIIDFSRLFGYSAGTIINTTADVATDVSKTGIDIAGGSIKNVGNLIQGKTGPEINIKEKPCLDNNNDNDNDKGKYPKDLDIIIQKKIDEKVDKKIEDIDKRPTKYKEYKADTDDNTIQKPIASDKINWCLVGEYQNKRGCVSVTESDKCLSGQIFPSKEMCLNPTLTP